MSFKSILTVLSAPRQVPQLERAVALARAEDAHLEILCLGVDNSQPAYFFPGGTAYGLQEAIAAATEDAKLLDAKVTEAMAGTVGLCWSSEALVAQSGGIAGLVGMRARFADLTVLASPYAEGQPGESEMICEAALFEGACPVMVLPVNAPAPSLPPKKVLVAWNQSAEALAAIRRAMPLLQAARSVEITCIDPQRAGPERSDPGGALTQMLVRHGINAEIAVLARTAPRISDEINRRAIEIDADLVVMGAYGHSRLRQAILGGATRNMLEQAELPVFMAR
ncbi:universal stress protein [Paracoccus sp. 1_MG-2023]|uniref:universal stress protein n=1 Tax=unclassified Paracoccus (in: a-proteobacteria) TaxID=2688777 RepID=UPI001C09259F|nr:MULTISPECIES: universal stress protein [unclassified Paracoccus (in: a-proteobacteria)]MBU2956435.1 universal stress protein [Paracoccus sp. C2R09]MDO6669831.1 universal stress protein [Paracoccus sp. 1_MG-2023]